MKILVAVKHGIDYAIKMRLTKNQDALDLGNLPTSINPFDAIAMEEAVRLKEQGHAHEIVAVTIGEAAADATLRHALAMGADRARRIEQEAPLVPLQIAQILQSIVEEEKPDLILMGKQAIDDDAAQTGPMLAALMGWPQVTFVSHISPQGSEWVAEREVDEGIETVTVTLPCVMTADLRLNTPRYLGLPHMMRAKKIPIELSSCTPPQHPSLVTVMGYSYPLPRVAGAQVKDGEELLTQLRPLLEEIQ